MSSPRSHEFLPGDPIPWFIARSSHNPRYAFHHAAGRHIVLAFLESGGDARTTRFLHRVVSRPDLFDDELVSFFGVTIDPEDEGRGRLEQRIPGYRFIWDTNRRLSVLYRALPSEEATSYNRFILVLDPRLRVLARMPIDDPDRTADEVLQLLERLPRPGAAAPAEPHAPVVIVPRVFEPELCSALVAYHDATGGKSSGFMREQGDRTVLVVDHDFKRRTDRVIEDEQLKNAAMFRLHDRLLIEVHRAFQFRASRIERHIVACYAAEERGFFAAHRDNTTRGTAHRRFAVTINLNTGDYDGGQLCFPEYGSQTYAPPLGGALVFSCALLHEAVPVTLGRRYAYLPFLYDEAAAAIRRANQRYLEPAAEDEVGET